VGLVAIYVFVYVGVGHCEQIYVSYWVILGPHVAFKEHCFGVPKDSSMKVGRQQLSMYIAQGTCMCGTT